MLLHTPYTETQISAKGDNEEGGGGGVGEGKNCSK